MRRKRGPRKHTVCRFERSRDKVRLMGVVERGNRELELVGDLWVQLSDQCVSNRATCLPEPGRRDRQSRNSGCGPDLDEHS